MLDEKFREINSTRIFEKGRKKSHVPNTERVTFSMYSSIHFSFYSSDAGARHPVRHEGRHHEGWVGRAHGTVEGDPPDFREVGPGGCLSPRREQPQHAVRLSNSLSAFAWVKSPISCKYRNLGGWNLVEEDVLISMESRWTGHFNFYSVLFFIGFSILVRIKYSQIWIAFIFSITIVWISTCLNASYHSFCSRYSRPFSFFQIVQRWLIILSRHLHSIFIYNEQYLWSVTLWPAILNYVTFSSTALPFCASKVYWIV